MSSDKPRPNEAQDFADHAGQRRASLLGELVDFLRHNKKWWLAPIIIMLLVIGALVILGGTAAAPFIYPFL